MIVNQHEQERNNWYLFNKSGINRESVYAELERIWTIVVYIDILYNSFNIYNKTMFSSKW